MESHKIPWFQSTNQTLVLRHLFFWASEKQMSARFFLEILSRSFEICRKAQTLPRKRIFVPSGYVKIAIENDHRYSGFTH